MSECPSFPSWERGLKPVTGKAKAGVTEVVPLVGTWIETYEMDYPFILSAVVPLVGTWIETYPATQNYLEASSRSPRGNVD